MIWALFTLMLGAAAAFVAAPLLTRRCASARQGVRADVFRRQLAEIEAELETGVIAEPEAAALRTEAQRRLLAAAESEPGVETMTEPRTIAALAIAGFVVATGGGLYLLKGSPAAPSIARVATRAPAEETGAAPGLGSVESMIESLKAKLAADPDNAEGWRMLGWSYFNTDRPNEAADAYARAVALAPDNAGFQSAYGEALVRKAGGFVTPEAASAFDRALKVDSLDARARFFKGLQLDQAGDAEGAILAWIEIVNAAPDDAEWVGDLRRRITERAAVAGVDIAGKLSAPTRNLETETPGPSASQVSAAMAMPSADRAAMIEAMVEKLAARLNENPKDSDGWVRLIRSHMVLGRESEARADLAKALSAFSDDDATRARIAGEAEALGVQAN